MIKKLNFYHSLFFFNICIILSALEFLKNKDFLILCFFLILSIGISHGALDNLKGKKLLKILKFKSIFVFYIGYITLSLFVILCWILIPTLTLTIFLGVACYHFGKEDTDFLVKKKSFFVNLLFTLKGSIIIISPLLFNFQDTADIFKLLNFDISIFGINQIFLYSILFLSFSSNIALSFNQESDFKSLIMMDFISILILNFFLSPILAFTIYFCFLHSLRHSFSLIFELSKNFKRGAFMFIQKALPLTIATVLIYIISNDYLNNLFVIDETNI
jgi:beta-carotene 15,15''-monooxygenase, Brp/Blh family